MAGINPKHIVQSHLKIFKDYSNDSHPWLKKDIVLFFLFPGIIGVCFTYLGIDYRDSTRSMVASIAIFSGFMLNMLSVITNHLNDFKIEKKGLEKKDDKSVPETKKLNRFSRAVETTQTLQSSITFMVLFAVLLVVMLLLSHWNIFDWKLPLDEYPNLNLQHFIDWLIFSLLAHYLLLILYVVKHVHTVMTFKNQY